MTAPTVQPEIPNDVTDKLIAIITSIGTAVGLMVETLPKHPTTPAAAEAVAELLDVATSRIRRVGAKVALNAVRGYPLDEAAYTARAAARAVSQARDELLVFAATEIDDVNGDLFFELELSIVKCKQLADELGWEEPYE